MFNRDKEQLEYITDTINEVHAYLKKYRKNSIELCKAMRELAEVQDKQDENLTLIYNIITELLDIQDENDSRIEKFRSFIRFQTLLNALLIVSIAVLFTLLM